MTKWFHKEKKEREKRRLAVCECINVCVMLSVTKVDYAKAFKIIKSPKK